MSDIQQQLIDVLVQAIENSGFSVSGPTDIRAAEHGEPVWVCNARGVLAEASVSTVSPSSLPQSH